jgi:hypothetical protein
MELKPLEEKKVHSILYVLVINKIQVINKEKKKQKKILS